MARSEERFQFGTGRPCLDLVATVKSRLGDAPWDRLVDPATADRWLREAGFTLGKALTASDLDELRRLREAINLVLRAASAGNTDRQSLTAAVDCVNRSATEGRPPTSRLRIDAAGALVAEVTPMTIDHVLRDLASDAVDLVSGSARDLLVQCAAHTCGTYFVATSRGARRQWCSSATCGNRERVGAYRARHTTG